MFWRNAKDEELTLNEKTRLNNLNSLAKEYNKAYTDAEKRISNSNPTNDGLIKNFFYEVAISESTTEKQKRLNVVWKDGHNDFYLVKTDDKFKRVIAMFKDAKTKEELRKAVLSSID